MKKQIHKSYWHEFYFYKNLNRDRNIYKCDICWVRKEIYSTGAWIQADLDRLKSTCWLSKESEIENEKAD